MSAKKDWQLYRKKAADWQESYMDRLERSYIALLEGDELPSEKFCKLQKRIKDDCKELGVSMELDREYMHWGIAYFIKEGIITLDDLGDFSPELIAQVKQELE